MDQSLTKKMQELLNKYNYGVIYYDGANPLLVIDAVRLLGKHLEDIKYAESFVIYDKSSMTTIIRAGLNHHEKTYVIDSVKLPLSHDEQHAQTMLTSAINEALTQKGYQSVLMG